VTVFSQNLIEETIECFKKENNLNISEETANEYLESLAGLYLAFADTGENVSSELLMKPDEIVLPIPPSGASDPNILKL